MEFQKFELLPIWLVSFGHLFRCTLAIIQCWIPRTGELMLCCVPMAAARMQKHSGGIQRSQIKLSCSLICHCWLQAAHSHTHTYKESKTIQQIKTERTIKQIVMRNLMLAINIYLYVLYFHYAAEMRRANVAENMHNK